LDADAPSAPQGLTAKRTGGTVHLAWTANTESDLAGYNVYRATSAGGPFTRINPSLVTGPIYDDSSLPASDLLWYAVTALDQGGNESAKSAAVSVSGTDKFGITLLPPYPTRRAGGGPVGRPGVVRGRRRRGPERRGSRRGAGGSRGAGHGRRLARVRRRPRRRSREPGRGGLDPGSRDGGFPRGAARRQPAGM